MARVEVKRARGPLPSVGYGCTLPAAGLGVVWIALAVLALSQWDSLGILARIGSFFFIAMGVLCTLPLLGMWTLRRWMTRFTKNLAIQINTAHAEQMRQNQDLYAGDLQYRPAEETDWQVTDREQYEQASNHLLAVGCVLIGDVVNVKAEAANDVPAVHRMLVSSDGRSWLVIHREASSSPGPQPLTIDVVSEFLDGTFCCTSNSPAISRRTLPPQLRMDSCPPELPAAEIMQRHEASLRMQTSSEAIIFSTLADVLASQQRKYALIAGFKAMSVFNDSGSA